MKIKISYLIFMLLPFAVTGAAFIFMPDEVPMHYGIDFTVDRWGSKFELLVIPAAFTVLALVMLLLSKLADKAESESKNNEKIVLITGLVILIIENIINLVILYAAYNRVTDLKSLPIDFVSLIMVLFGVVFIIIGNIMPKARLNSMVGFRIPWTMKNETVWKKNQLFAGALSMIVGVLIVVGGLFFFKGFAALFYTLGMLIVMTAADIVYSYFVMKNTKAEEE